MRTIQVSTDVFAAIWRDRQEGENTEDEILRRKFGIAKKTVTNESGNGGGIYDSRYNARFPEGFEIFRVYKGKEYRAKAEGGVWHLLNTHARYASLKDLSNATVGHENAWTGWFYVDASRKRRPVSDMRDPSRISRHRS